MNFLDIEFKYDMKITKKVALKWETQPDPTQAFVSRQSNDGQLKIHDTKTL